VSPRGAGQFGSPSTTPSHISEFEAGPATASDEGRDEAYWMDVAKRVQQYMMQAAGDQYTRELFRGFANWLGRSPNILQQYEEGDDPQREAIVDQYLEKALAHTRNIP
jgi:hypothetical protein